uniref:ATP synthase F0 subunit 8 n=1 Tax=Ectopleura larynx TaxID=264052 RepID=G9ISH4_9CNID|nr:ATP synthase F0 subunit 8 [Ectopleura larynx]
MSQLDLSIYFNQFLPTLILIILFLYLMRGIIISFLRNKTILKKEVINSPLQSIYFNSKSSLIRDILNK